MSAFNEKFYTSLYPEVGQAVFQGVYKDGLEHYLRYGASEGRWGSDTLEYNEVSYLAANPDVAAAVRAGIFTSGYQHYIAFGNTEGRLSSPYGYFSAGYYRAENPDLPIEARYADFVSYSTPVALTKHFLTVGTFEGRSPSATVFNEFGYLAKNPDVAAAVFSGALPSGKAHYDAWGKSEGRDASGRAFDEVDYLQRYPDVVAAMQRGLFTSGEEQYGIYGKIEGRTVKYFGRSIDASVATSGFQIVGAAGNDTLTGGNGNDTLWGGVGDNVLSGNAGDDSIVVANGRNTIDGGAGNDTITSGNGGTTIYGGSGNDVITSGFGDNIIYGGSGDDVIKSGVGNSLIVGGDGDDTIHVGSGINTLTGGNGADRFVYNYKGVYQFSPAFMDDPGDRGANDVITDFQSGIDKIDVSGVFMLSDPLSKLYSLNGTHIVTYMNGSHGGRTDYDMSVTYGTLDGAPAATINFTYGNFLYQASTNPSIFPNHSTIVLPGVSTLAASDFIFS